MKVYLLIYSYPYEGDSLEGVFYTKELAEERLKSYCSGSSECYYHVVEEDVIYE